MPGFVVRVSAAGFAAAVMCIQIASPVAAEPFSAPEILFDISDAPAEANGPPLLISAYQPGPGRPVVENLTGIGNRAAALPDPSRPAPSIIIGTVIAGQERRFGIPAFFPATVAKYAFAYNDLEARTALRKDIPDLYRQLVEEGRADPPATELVVALQTELKRMKCYRSRIDGDWGPGSRRSVTAYLKARGDHAGKPDLRATTELFRTILLNDDAVCAVATATPPARTSSRRPARAAAPAAKPAAKPVAPAKRTLSGGGIGVFR